MRLPASLDLTAADRLHGQLQDRLGRGEALLIEGGDVERVSTACVQVLVAAAASAREAGLAFRLAPASDILRHAVSDLGLAGVLGMDPA
jgi:anti-anti-sigma regulatory factor